MQRSDLPKCFTATLRHHEFAKALTRLHEISSLSSSRLALVTGPTGVGKTTFLNRFAQDLADQAAPEIALDPEIIPYARHTVKAPGQYAFSWKQYYQQLLHALAHPFTESRFATMAPGKANPPESGLQPISSDALQRKTESAFFNILKKTISHRRPRAILIDEAHHFLCVSSSQSLKNQLEQIKYVADETKTLHVMFGTYELTELMDPSAALIRRREIIHLPRYIFSPENPESSLREFARAIAVFEKDLKDVSVIELLKEVPFLYQGCVGCIGVLRDWMLRAYNRAVLVEKVKLTKEHLEKTQLSPGDRLELLNHAKSGEDYFRRKEMAESDYLKQLGFTAPSALIDSNGAQKKKPKPFTRKPHNDKVGFDE